MYTVATMAVTVVWTIPTPMKAVQYAVSAPEGSYDPAFVGHGDMPQASGGGTRTNRQGSAC